MKLRMTEQLHISSVSRDTLPAGAEFEVSDALGEELLKKHPDKVERMKAERRPKNKAEKPDANK